MKPSIGCIVHFVSHPGSFFPSQHCAAIITACNNVDDIVDLIVFPPNGQDSYTRRNVPYNERVKKEGTWHFPEVING